ncbi:TlpA family protein disulfide reductase [Micromonospora sp. NPDC000089]|uniref:TlpA family protein disulfide reductase n=1 Tax=unclassified Micromonospora TaxID=2617518 RepID=UPI0036BD71E8
MRSYRRTGQSGGGPAGRRRAAVGAALSGVVLLTGAACAVGPAPGGPAAVGPAATGPPFTATSPAATPPAGAAPAGGAAGAPAAPGTPPAAVPDALRFTGTTLDGGAFSAAGLAGRPVVLWFWAPWCATCASQAWTVAEIAPKYRDTVPIVGVAGLGDRKAMKQFVTEFELTGTPQLDDHAGALWRRFEVVEQSTFLIIDRDGKVVHQGFLAGDELARRVAALAAG